jgi:hypothetical protein
MRLFLLSLGSFLLLPLSCNWKSGVEIIGGGVDTLAGMVFAGEDSNGNWMTLAFREENSAACFVADGAEGHNFEFSYSYDKSAGSGSIIKNENTSAIALFVPGAFELTENSGNLVFGDTGPKLLQVRDAEGATVTDLPVPFEVKPLPENGSLDGTVWAATGFRTKDWTTLSIVSPSEPGAGTINISHSFDASSFNRVYTNYDPETQKGTLAYIGEFKIEGDTFVFLNFYGHGGEVFLKRMR